ncbi:hypothetical protein Chor_012027 [Crotalus horridus]
MSLPPAASSGDPRPLTPGAQGLKNHGNTCFLNAVVQCLSHTELLAAFLLLALPDQPSLPRPGSKAATGEVTQHLAALVRALWTLEYTPQLSADFKVGSTREEKEDNRKIFGTQRRRCLVIIVMLDPLLQFPEFLAHTINSLSCDYNLSSKCQNVVSKYGAQFRGNAQHDALEFLLWLLDRMHEDLRSVSFNQKLKISGKHSLWNANGSLACNVEMMMMMMMIIIVIGEMMILMDYPAGLS